MHLSTMQKGLLGPNSTFCNPPQSQVKLDGSSCTAKELQCHHHLQMIEAKYVTHTPHTHPLNYPPDPPSSVSSEGTPTCQEGLHEVKAVLQAEGQHANCRADRVATSNPVPEGEGILRVDAKLRNQLQVGADSNHVLGD